MFLYRFAARLGPGQYPTGQWRRFHRNAVNDCIGALGYVEPLNITVFTVSPHEWLRGKPLPPRVKK